MKGRKYLYVLSQEAKCFLWKLSECVLLGLIQSTHFWKSEKSKFGNIILHYKSFHLYTGDIIQSFIPQEWWINIHHTVLSFNIILQSHTGFRMSKNKSIQCIIKKTRTKNIWILKQTIMFIIKFKIEPIKIICLTLNNVSHTNPNEIHCLKETEGSNSFN